MVGKRLENGRLIITLSGRIEASTAPEEGARIFEIRRAHPELDVEMDAAELSYISSAGLRELLKFYKQEKKLRITHVAEEVYNIFDITGFTDFLEVETDERTSPIEEAAGINSTTWETTFIPTVRMFEEEAKKAPDHLAVVSSERSLTYRELNEESNRIANLLQYVGVRPDDIVMVLLPRSVDALTACLGVMKAGAAFLAASTGYPDERLQYMYENASCKFLITTHEICFDRLDLIIELRKRPLFFENIVTYFDTDSTKQRIEEEDLAYCIYTSGSTGKPKGVLIEQENLSNFLNQNPKNRETMGLIENGSVILAVAPLTFDFSLMEIYIPLTSGRTVALASEEEIQNPLLLRKFMLEHRVDAVLGTPSFLNTMLSLPQMEDAMKAVRVYDFGAEAFPGSLYDKIHSLNPDAVIMNGYGPTETTISCTMKVIDSPDNITIGIPNANVYVYVVDEENKEVPDGEIGELLIAGKGVGRGYINLPEKTAAVFINFKGMRAYKSGDLVRITEDGEIEYHGRRDNQVKFHGLRIELGEIEEVMGKCPGVESCAVTVVEERYLCFYYVGKAGITEDAVRSYAQGHLAHYMVPSLYISLDAMPVTANMKIDRRALPIPEIQRESVTPPQNEIQQKLFEIVRKILPEGEIGIETDLFQMGISSLEVMMLLTMIGDEFRIVVKNSDLQTHPTIAEMEALVQSAPRVGESIRKDKYFCNLIQVSMYFGILSCNSPMHTLPVVAELPEGTDIEKLVEAVRTAVRAHPGLSARFFHEGETVYEAPEEERLLAFSPEVITCTDAEFEELKGTLRETLIMLTDPLLFRIRIYRTKKRMFLYAATSHLISDGDSVGILFRDIGMAYQGEALKKERMTLFELGEEHWNYMNSMLYGSTIGFYRKLMAGRDHFSTLPVTGEGGALAAGFLEREMAITMEQLTRYASQLNTTVNAILTGIVGIAIAKACGEDSAAFAVGYNGRNDSRLTYTFGCIANILLVKCRVEVGFLLRDYFGELQKQIFDAMSVTMVPFTEMAESYSNFLDIVFVNQTGENDAFELEGQDVEIEFLTESSFSETHKVVLQSFLSGDRLHFAVDYHANLYAKGQIEELLSHIERMLTELPDSSVSALLHSERI